MHIKLTMRSLFLTPVLILLALVSYAQSGRVVRGSVLDSTKLSLPGSSIKLISDKGDSVLTIADVNGKFEFGSVKGTKLTLTITSIGFQTLKKHFALDNDTKPVVLDPIILSQQTNMLNQVNIVGVNPVSFKEDTVEYKVSAYKVRENAPVEDVLKKLPGVDVDANGNVTAQGKQVTKVRVNGKDFFGGDVQTATKNLPADVIESIQVIDDYGDQANLTGVKTGEPNKILNITVRKDKNYGYFGQATIGDGEDALPKNPGVTNDNRYVGLLNFFKFKGDQQVAVLGNLNNTNVNTFSFNAPGGGAGGGGGGGFNGGGGGGGGRGNALRGGGGGGATGLATNANGVTLARSIGGNYRDQWGKALSVYGSYSFSNFSTFTQSTTLQTNNFQTPSTSSQTGTEKDNPINHRFNFNLEFRPDTINYLKVTPTFSYASTNTNDIEAVTSTRNGVQNQAYTSVSNNNSQAPNYGLIALYNHRFNGHGRNLSINLSANSAKSTAFDNPVYDFADQTVHTAPENQKIYSNSRTTTLGANLSYLEPLSKVSFLEFNYTLNHSYTTSDKETDTLRSKTNIYDNYSFLSNNYNYTFVTNRFGLNYRFVEKKYNYTLGIGVQPGTLDGESLKSDQPSNTHITTFNIIPTARFIYNFSRGKALSMNYNGSSNQPTFSQLQPVIDFSNALYPVQGNPNLKPEFNNSFQMRYNNFSFQTGNLFFSTFQFTQTDNKIVAYTITYPSKFNASVLTPTLQKLQNTNLTDYLNTSGYYQATGALTYAKPWSNRKFTLILNGNVTYTNNIGYSSSVDSMNVSSAIQKNIAKTLTLNPGLRFRADITDVIDAQLLTSYAINRTTNSITDGIYSQNTNIRTWTVGLSGKNYFWKDWTLGYDLTKQTNYGYASSVKVTNPTLLNTYVERRFLKDHRGTLRLAAFDLFNQNNGFSTTTNGSIVTQSNVNRLGRYYLLTFTLRLQKFAGKSPQQGGQGGGFRRDRGDGGGGPGGGGPGGPGNGPE